MVKPSTRRKFVMILAIILAALMILPVLISAIIPADGAPTRTDLQQLRDKANRLAEETGRIQDELDRVSGDRERAAERKVFLDRQISLIEEEIETNQALISELGVQIADRQAELERADEEERRETQLFLERVRVMEEAGEASYIGIILQADSFEDMLSRMEIVNDILEYDRSVMASLRETRERIARERAALEDDQGELLAVKAGLSLKEEGLQGQYDEATRLMAELYAEENQYIQAHEQAKAAEEDLSAEIKEMLAAIEKAEREEKERLERAAREKAEREAREKAERDRIAREKAKAQAGSAALSSESFSWPLPGHYDISSYYGMRFHPILKVNALHTGIDMGAPTGTVIVAARSGTVVTAGYNTGYGNYVLINHGEGVATLYGHLSKFLVRDGQSVNEGDKIGQVGSTGWSTGPHLHFEIIVNGTAINPLAYFK